MYRFTTKNAIYILSGEYVFFDGFCGVIGITDWSAAIDYRRKSYFADERAKYGIVIDGQYFSVLTVYHFNHYSLSTVPADF